jgi:hypothetical protein
VLLQVRGDWPFLKTLFSVPGWQNKLICWKCRASHEGDCSYHITGGNAYWRGQRYRKGEYLQQLRAAGTTISPLFSAPDFELDMIVLDWLHIMDLGVSQDVIGNFFNELIQEGGFRGPSKEARLAVLWEKIQDYYREARPSSRLSSLTQEMIQVSTKKPKLRAKGGETRYLVPFAAALARDFAHLSPHWTAVSSMLQLLLAIMENMASAAFDASKVAALSRKFCVLLAALEREADLLQNPKAWRMKPKAHLMQEMLEFASFYVGNPSSFWCYKDESWCGYWAKASQRRGGANNAATVAERFLTRFRALNQDL